MRIDWSNICNPYLPFTVGTKVVQPGAFQVMLLHALREYAMPADGKGFVPLPDALPCVSCGVARRAGLRPQDYVVREWRGEVGLFAPRRYAVKATSLHVVVYTGDTYRTDAQVDAAEACRVADADYVIVAVLASAGPRSPLSSHRFVRNLAGGNTSYASECYTIERAVEEAKEIVTYEQEWVTVSD